jgi:hypothetical protein
MTPPQGEEGRSRRHLADAGGCVTPAARPVSTPSVTQQPSRSRWHRRERQGGQGRANTLLLRGRARHDVLEGLAGGEGGGDLFWGGGMIRDADRGGEIWC